MGAEQGNQLLVISMLYILSLISHNTAVEIKINVDYETCKNSWNFTSLSSTLLGVGERERAET